MIKNNETFQVIDRNHVSGSGEGFACDTKGQKCVTAGSPITITGKRVLAEGVADAGMEFLDLTFEPPATASWEVDTRAIRDALERSHTAFSDTPPGIYPWRAASRKFARPLWLN